MPSGILDVTRPAVASAATQADDRFITLRDDNDAPIRLLLSECRASAPVFTALVNSAAGTANVDPRALAVRALLHLPRVATPAGRVTRKQIERELSHGARLLRRDADTVKHLLADGKSALPGLVFVADFDPMISDRLFSSLHYLRSARPGSRNFALVDSVTGRPVTICSVSPLEWKLVGNYIRHEFGIPQEKIWDVSRVYSCGAAPPNAISYLLSRVRSSLGRGTEIELLVTVVDPNLGFRGSSYRAAGWRQWLTVQPRPYLYHNCRYMSPRQLRQRFGTSSLAELKAGYPGERFEQSRTRLLDSLIFCCRMKDSTEAIPLSDKCPLHR